MKISINWIRQLTNFELPTIDELVKKIGAQLGEVESVEDLGAKYQGIIVAKVVSCEDHPNADRLHVCKIDDGGKAEKIERDENGLVRVVCGAPNVRAGLTVAWLPPGSTVPASFGKDPFVLAARDLRGITSNGMLASAKELAISDDHEGILEVDKKASPGDDFAALYKLDDYVIDIENKMFTHRPDCFGALGVAREIAGILGHKFVSPDWYLASQTDIPLASDHELALEVVNDASNLVPRFMALAMSNVEVKPSPIWLQVALAKIGQKPINNVVDLTNFYMQFTGQPLHAYDYDKLAGHKLGARLAKKGETAKLLNSKTYQLDVADIVIVDGESVVGLAGVMGGLDSEVTNDTKNIVLECASFDMYSVRRTSMRHGLFTDAVTRFTKGQSPLQNRVVLAKVAQSLEQIASAKVASHVFDEKNGLVENEPLDVGANFITDRLGLELKPSEIDSLLENVEFDVHETEPGNICVLAPFWRTDIEIPEDIVEEVGRLYGYDKLPLALPKRSLAPASKDALLEAKASIRDRLASAGANEVLTYSFVHGRLLESCGQDASHAYKLANALSPDLQYYRLSLMPSLLEKVHAVVKSGYDKFVLFEMGRTHIVGQSDADNLPRADELTALVATASDKTKTSGAAYYLARKYLINLINARLDFRPIPEEMLAYDITKPYEPSRSALVYHDEKFLGIIGEFTAGTRKNLKLPKYTAGWELDTRALIDLLANKTNYVELPRYPKVEQDISLKIASNIKYDELYSLLWQTLEKARPDHTLMTLGPLDIFQKAADEEYKQLAFRLTIASYEKTMRTEEVVSLLDVAATAASQAFAATRL